MIEFLIIFFSGYVLGLVSLIVVYQVKKPYDGVMQITDTDDGKKMFSLELNRDPMSLEDRDQVVFLVKASERSRKEN